MEWKMCEKNLGKIVLLNLPQHLDKPVRVKLKKISLCVDDDGNIYEQATVADRRGNEMNTRLKSLSEVKNE